MDTEFFKDLERFSLLVRKRVSTAYTGSRRSVRFGHGISPVGYREYRKGDDIKLVDWKVYGRTEKLYVREHEEERSLMVHILIDSSASMGYAGKFQFASKIAAGTAFMAVQGNEKFSLNLFAEGIEPGAPGRGRGFLMRYIDLLDDTVPKGKTSIKKAADQFDRLASSTSLVVMISDFLDRPEDIESAIYRLSAHDLVLIQVLAPGEVELSLSGDVRFVDMESDRRLVTRISQRLKDEYRDRMKDHAESIASTSSKVNADFFQFKADMPVFDAFNELNQRASKPRI
ncbi:MAG: DUF58 domain-containing protein [Methanotrichaceae archaeon]|nr:DUF58 domain-containing protein [Methanotrichaceae archaeon]